MTTIYTSYDEIFVSYILDNTEIISFAIPMESLLIPRFGETVDIKGTLYKVIDVVYKYKHLSSPPKILIFVV